MDEKIPDDNGELKRKDNNQKEDTKNGVQKKKSAVLKWNGGKEKYEINENHRETQQDTTVQKETRSEVTESRA